MNDSIELTKFNGMRFTVFKRWVTSVHELPAYHPVPRICCTVFIGQASEGINVQETYADVLDALNNDSSQKAAPEPANVALVR